MTSTTYEIYDFLIARYTLDELYEETDSGDCRAVEIAAKVYEMDEAARLALNREVGSAMFDREAVKYGVDSKNLEFSTELPPEILVKKMLGRGVASEYRALLERAESMGVSLNRRDPYKLVNKRRMRKIIGELSDFVETRGGRNP